MSKSKFHWKDDHTLFLIEEVKSSPYMWDPNNISYKNKSKKHLFWTKTIKKLNSVFKSDGVFTHADIVRKWNNTKIYFMTESQKILNSMKSGAGTDDVEISNWRFYDKLLFLKQTTQAMPSVNNYNKQSLNELSRDSITDELNSSSTSPWSPFDEVEFLDSDDTATSDYIKKITGQNISAETNNINNNNSRMLSPPVDVINVTLSPCEPSTSHRYITSTPTLKTSNCQSILKPSPMHPSKKARMSTKSKKEILADSCLQSFLKLSKFMESSQKKCSQQPFADYVAQDLENFDSDLRTLAKNKINNVLFEINQIQDKRNDVKSNSNKYN